MNYTLSSYATRIEASLGTSNTTSAFDQGVAFQGTWTIPVCDVGSNTNWVGNEDSAGMPCCCGPAADGTSCKETKEFIYAANLDEWGQFYADCKEQYPGFEGPPKKSMGVRSMGETLGLAILLALLVGWSFY